MSLTGLVLAAGSGKRMNSNVPKVLHSVAGTPMIEWVILALKQIPCDQVCLILNPNVSPFKELLDRYPDLVVCIQKEANGTAGAVASAQHYFDVKSNIDYGMGSLLKGKKTFSQHVLICAGDTPALDVSILKEFVTFSLKKSSRLALLGMSLENPTGYGRMLLTKEAKLEKIVEEKDADEATKKVTLCNSGIVFADVDYLFHLLKKIDNRNAQGEFYLTECVELSAQAGEEADVFVTDQWQSFQGVNDKDQLSSLDLWFRKHKITSKNRGK